MSDFFDDDPFFDIGDVINSVIGFVGGFFSAFEDDIGWIADAVNTLGETIARDVSAIGTVLGDAVKAIPGLLRKLGDQIRRVIGDLTNLLGHLVGLLKRIRDWLDMVYTRFLKPLLLLLQHIRQFLVVLRLFHLKFADKLDKYLAQLQTDINRPFLIIRGTLNGILTTIELIIDPRGVLTAGPFLWAVWADLGQIAGLFHAGGMLGVPKAQPAVRAHYADYFSAPSQQSRAALNARGTLDQYQLQQQADMAAALKANV